MKTEEDKNSLHDAPRVNKPIQILTPGDRW
jgi:hypothetical protein